MFIAITVVPAVSLAWLGWRMVEQDRLLENKRVQEKRDQAADLAAAAMQRILAEAEERLTTFNAAPSSPGAALGDGAALVFGQRRSARSCGNLASVLSGGTPICGAGLGGACRRGRAGIPEERSRGSAPGSRRIGA